MTVRASRGIVVHEDASTGAGFLAIGRVSWKNDFEGVAIAAQVHGLDGRLVGEGAATEKAHS